MEDYYAILGVAKNADQKEIEQAFKKLARKWHPDYYETKPAAEKEAAEEQMRLINKAKEVLCNPQKRKEYDNPSAKPGSVVVDPMKKTEAEEMADILKKAFRKG